jgi:hypothetical protein
MPDTDRTDMTPDDYDSLDRHALDANAVAGTLMEVFGTEMTVVASRCAHCGNQAQIGTLRAYVGGPGIVLRCSICTEMVIRIMQCADGTYLVDARGAAYLRM